MTLAVAVVTADGLVVAADSRTSLTIPGHPSRVLSDYTHKVFRVGGVAVATYGFAFISGRNVSGHMGEFVRALGDEFQKQPDEVDLMPLDVAQRLGTYFGDLLEEHFATGQDQRPDENATVLGFLVAGYEDGSGVLHEVLLPSNRVTKQFDSTAGGAAWRGQTDVVTRLIKGVDVGNLPQLDPEAIAAIGPTLPRLEYVIPFNFMNLQDAIDFSVLLIRTTIDVQRLTYGLVNQSGSWPGVGGPIELASVRPIEGFAWVQRTMLLGERPAGTAEQI